MVIKKTIENKEFILFFKPYGVTCQFSTGHLGIEKDNLSGFQLPKDIYPVGRLDKKSEGLLLLSNDGEFIHDFLRPGGHEKFYLVQVENLISKEVLLQLCEGLNIKDYKTQKTRAWLVPSSDYGQQFIDSFPDRSVPIRYRAHIPTSFFVLALTEGKYHQVRRMTAQVGFPTLRLLRMGLGNLIWGKNIHLKPGEFTRLNQLQTSQLLKTPSLSWHDGLIPIKPT